LDVSGTTTADFVVVPYLRVEWVGESVVLEGTISVTFKFKRNASPVTDDTMPAFLDCQLFDSFTEYVTNNDFEFIGS